MIDPSRVERPGEQPAERIVGRPRIVDHRRDASGAAAGPFISATSWWASGLLPMMRTRAANSPRHASSRSQPARSTRKSDADHDGIGRCAPTAGGPKRQGFAPFGCGARVRAEPGSVE